MKEGALHGTDDHSCAVLNLFQSLDLTLPSTLCGNTDRAGRLFEVVPIRGPLCGLPDRENVSDVPLEFVSAIP